MICVSLVSCKNVVSADYKSVKFSRFLYGKDKWLTQMINSYALLNVAWRNNNVCTLGTKLSKKKALFPRGGGYYTYFGYGDVPSGRVSIFANLV